MSTYSIDRLARQVEASAQDRIKMEQVGAQLVHWESNVYPSLLREIIDPPKLFFAKGNWPLLWEARPWVAIVGGRKATRWGLEKTKEIVSALVGQGIGIVSGLAYGIDGEAHRAAVAYRGSTWGVLGSGIDRIYPLRHRHLADQMLKKGGLISEFPLGTKPYPGHFPQRNRILSGLSHAVIVVEATIRSGSLITAKFALEQGREVFAVPPPNNHVAYEGTCFLLEEGATPYESVDQVLELAEPLRSLSIQNRSAPRRQRPVSLEKKREIPQELIYLTQWLSKPRTLDYLVQKTKRSADLLLTDLILLEAKGLIRKKPGGVWQNR